MNILQDLFGSAQFIPHGICLLWRPDLLILHGGSDFLIAIAYLVIPFLITKAVRARPDLVDIDIARLFAAFILACALSHLCGLVTLWVPLYAIQGIVKALTATVSIYTAVQLYRVLPKFLTLPSRKDMDDKAAEVASQRKKKDEAIEARDKLSEFAHIASHDLRTPMRGVSNQTRFILEDYEHLLPEGARKRLDRILELCQQLNDTVSTLLSYSEISRSEAREDISVAKVIESLRVELEDVLEESNARIHVVGNLPIVHENPSDISVVFRNLITNGIKYNRSREKVIEVGFVEHVDIGRGVLEDAFFVRDNGIGIAEEHYRDIFKMFKRLNPEAEFGRSSGAGLSFVRQILEAGHGEIHVLSTPGKGSVFYFQFSRGLHEQVETFENNAGGFDNAQTT